MNDKIDWKEWLCHLLEAAYGIADEKRDMTTEEYEEYEKDGTESVMSACFSDNLTDEDIEKFKGWMEDIANRGI